MQTEFKNLLQGMKQTGEKIFLVENDRYYSYSQLAEDVVALADKVKGKNAVVVEAVNTYSFYVKIMALLLNKIPFLLLPPYQFHDLEFRTFLASEVQVDFYFSNLQDSFQEEVSNAGFISNEWIKQMVARGGSLFIVKTTGSSGKKFKFILHDALLFLGKYRLYNKTFDSTLAFSPAESIAGVETFLESVCLAKTLIACGEKPSPQKVVELIDKHRVDLFQTTPSFLNLMIISGLVTEKSLKTLRQVFFGSEQAHEKNLLYLMQKIPSVKLVQTYGMSEIGILATDVYEQKPWLTRPQKRLNDFFLEGNELVVKSKSMMLGYINYSNDSNVTIIGNEIWFKTQDVVEVEDDFYRILGRNSDVINIGGFKYFPFELEEKIMTLEGVENITILAERSEFLGVVVIGQVVLAENISELDFQIRFKKFSEENLPPYMRLHKIEFLKTPEVNFRSKKVRIR